MMALQPWFRPMVYGDSARTEMRAKEAMLKNFFQNVEVAVRDAAPGASAKWQVKSLEGQAPGVFILRRFRGLRLL